MNYNQKGNRNNFSQGGNRPNTYQGGARPNANPGGARPNTPPGGAHTSISQQNYVDEAEKAILALRRPGKRPGDPPSLSLTTSKIRNLLSMTAELSTDARHIRGDELPAELQGRVQYLRMRIAYEAGRDRDVKEFVTRAGLLEEIRNVGASRERLLLFCRYMEALVAYHKFHGGKD